MNIRRQTKVLVGLIVILPVLVHLFYSIWASPLTSYYLTVGELPSRGRHLRTVRVGGEVVAGSIMWSGSEGELRFDLTDGVDLLPVVYSGWAPDAFRSGVTAIVEGQLDAEGRLLAHRLLLRCPHRYVAG